MKKEVYFTGDFSKRPVVIPGIPEKYSDLVFICKCFGKTNPSMIADFSYLDSIYTISEINQIINN